MKYLNLVFLTILTACAMEGVEISKTSNPEAKVKLLFEVDDCKVYRFMDGASFIYFTNCKGSTEWQEQRSKHTERRQVTGGG